MPIAHTLLHSLLALSCAGLGGFLAWHHPLSPALALGACALLTAIVFMRLNWWPAVVLGLLPLAGLMPWTGWVTVEEFDLVVLSVAAGGYARLATSQGLHSSLSPLLPPLLIGLPYVVSTLVGLQRGIHDAGGLSWGWWQGYAEPLNALRLAKPLLEVLLVLPMWVASRAIDERKAERAFEVGMLMLLAGVVTGVAWERVSFTGLLNFSADYRATGPFWEMHVGGAALDAAVVIAMPFSVLALMRARRPMRWALLSALCAGGLYVALVTFSRIVYAAVPLSVCVALWLHAKSRTAGNLARPDLTRAGWLALALTAFGAMAVWAFTSGGYRGLLMLWCVAAVSAMLVRLPVARPAGLLLALAAFLLAWALFLATLLPSQRSTLPLFLALLMATGAMAGTRKPGPRWAWCGFTLLVAAWMPSLRWDPAAALVFSLSASFGAWGCALAAVPLVHAANGGRVPGWRAVGQWWVLSMAVTAITGVFLAGGYMSQRLQQTSQDGSGRQVHWRHVLSLLGSDMDWAVGKGLGRYHAHHVLSGRMEDQSGDYRLVRVDGGQALVLTSGKHAFGAQGVFRVSQRIAAPQEVKTSPTRPLKLRFLYRSQQPVQLRAEVCEKHLIYNGTCVEANRAVGATGAQWQALEMTLLGRRAFDSSSLVRPLVVFSIGIDSLGGRVEFDELSLSGADGAELLANGNFEGGLARWFTTSDRDHLPWHAKNQMLHLLFEQGLLGVASFVLLLAATAWRLRTAGDEHERLKPAMAASIVGVLVVGLVDSLFDIPRVTFLALLLLMVALTLPARLRPAAAATPVPPATGADRPARG